MLQQTGEKEVITVLDLVVMTHPGTTLRLCPVPKISLLAVCRARKKSAAKKHIRAVT